jgi:hypothetical protein
MIYKGGKKVSPSPEIHGDFCYEPEVIEDLWKTEEHSLSGDSCIYRESLIWAIWAYSKWTFIH